MTVVLTVAKRDSNNQIVPLCTQKAIVQLPGEPVILYEPAPGTASIVGVVNGARRDYF